MIVITINFTVMHIKRFFEWISLKKSLDSIIIDPPYVSDGEMWWASLGHNVGSEIDGKSRLFSRPVIIFKKKYSLPSLAGPRENLECS